jgi:photosystem II stability/assembly factor-like uncharacterized protein
MKGLFARIASIVAVSLLAACNNGSSAPAPQDVAVVPGDGRVAVSWTMLPGVDYWLFYAPASSISTDNWASLPGSHVFLPAASPQVITGLFNGATYSFTVNGRYNPGPGGPGSPSVSAVPRIAGAGWTVGTALVGATTIDLRGVAHGAVFVAVGTGGAIFSSPDGVAWTPQNSNVTTPLNAVIYGGSYVVVGAGGVILRSSDAVTWTSPTNLKTGDLFAVTTPGTVYVAVGANGTIIASSDGGATWNPANSSGVITTQHLYALTYGNGSYVAVGAGGILLTSTDASNWTVVNSNTSSTLRGVAYGTALTSVSGILTATPAFVAVGDGGALVTSIDGGVTWTLQSPMGGTTVNVNAVTYGHQFIAVGDLGNIFTSLDGVTWQAAMSVTPATTNNLYAVARNPADPYGYSAVGAAGVNLSAF